MKNTFIITLLFFAAIGLNAQEYEPIIQDGNEWHTLQATVPGFPHPEQYATLIHCFAGDTMIDGRVYHEIMETVNRGQVPMLIGVIREENQKLWYRRVLDASLSEEKLLYDFTVSIGDSLVVGGLSSLKMVVDSVGLENIGGKDRKKIRLRYENEEQISETWVEGLGSDQGLLNSGWSNPEITGGYFRALCFHHDGELIWQNEDYEACVITSTGEDAEVAFSLYPNPAPNEVRIVGVDVREALVYNAFGQLVKAVKNTNEISVERMPAGVYLLHIQDRQGLFYKERITVVR